MTKTLDVLLVGSDPIWLEEAERSLADHGHRVHRCHEPGDAPFPCVGLTDPAACPLDHAIDVTLLVRRGVHPRPMPAEDGVRCAIRAGVPIVEDGSDFYDPFDPWVARRVGPHDDLVAECVAAADRPLRRAPPPHPASHHPARRGRRHVGERGDMPHRGDRQRPPSGPVRASTPRSGHAARARSSSARRRARVWPHVRAGGRQRPRRRRLRTTRRRRRLLGVKPRKGAASVRTGVPRTRRLRFGDSCRAC